MGVKSFANHMNLIPQHWKSKSKIFGEACEHWVTDNLSCLHCGGKLRKLPDCTKSVDHACTSCHKRYQVKSQRSTFIRSNGGVKITGAEYKTTLEGVGGWDLIMLHYDSEKKEIISANHVDEKDITSNNILPRKKLGPKARRAGWQGCYLTFDKDKINNIF